MLIRSWICLQGHSRIEPLGVERGAPPLYHLLMVRMGKFLQALLLFLLGQQSGSYIVVGDQGQGAKQVRQNGDMQLYD